MPLPAFEALVTLGISARIWASIITFAFMWIVRRKFYALPKIPPEFARDLRGQVVFITNAFTPLALPCVEALLGQGCKVIALASAEESRSPEILQLFAILQNNSAMSKNPEIYIETVELSNTESIQKFAKTWEEKGTLRTGALNESLKSRTHVAGVIFFPASRSATRDKNMELVQYLLPSFERTARVSAKDPLLGRSDAQTRVVQVVDTPLYAVYASKASFASPPEPSTPFWKTRAWFGMKDALTIKQMQNKLDQQSDLSSTICLTVSTGFRLSTTLDFSRSLLLTSGSAEPIRSLLRLSQLLFDLVTILPLWFCCKSNAEAAQIVEWVLLAPDAPQDRAMIQKGALHRDGKIARLPLLEDEQPKPTKL